MKSFWQNIVAEMKQLMDIFYFYSWLLAVWQYGCLAQQGVDGVRQKVTCGTNSVLHSCSALSDSKVVQIGVQLGTQ